MSSVKERLFGAITVMNETDAKRLWDYVVELYADPWNGIEEEAPDEIDLQMIREARSDPDCHELASDDEVQRVLGQ